MTVVTSAEAQKNFGRYRERALVEPVVVTQYGKPSVVIISAAEYERLKEFSENIVESINVGILAADLEDRVESWNTQIERLTGIPRQSAVGRRLAELFPAELCERFDQVPFFWSAHYDVSINYVGHAERWDALRVEGDPHARDAAVRYERAGRLLALATIFRDEESLRTEIAMERER